VPIGNKAAKARLHQMRLEKTKNIQTRQLWKQLIEQEVYETSTDLRQNWRRIQAAVQGVDAAYNDYRVEQSQFQLGFRTSTDVLFSAARLADAQLRRIRSYVEYEIAQIRLARATGTLLGYGNIQLNTIDISQK
ncbi:MAG: TolC family protein, partial [Planctomycetes bacterium]|nr:TolC family protein [Planctomycetota bacterium]